jgi:subtilisin family serine protease
MVAAKTLPEILFVEPNQRVYVSQDSTCHEQATSETWGLDRVDQRDPVPTTTSGTYKYSTGDDGQGVDVYILDTGIYVDHTEFQGRAVWGFTAADITDGDVDGNGHGTHVAGTVGSQTYGVAKNTILTAVKVLNNDGAGSTAGIVEALDWILGDHAAKEAIRGEKPKAVLSLSLGMNGTSATMEDALSNVIMQGLSVVVAAGNSYMDACDYSPARVPAAITVGASDYLDKAAYFTNWGTCLDVFAPGVYVLSTYISSPTSLAYGSGTSMAAPHVTGVVARYLSTHSTAPTPSSVRDWLVNQATSGALAFNGTDEMSSPNKLLYVECYYGDDGNMIKANTVSIALLLITYVALHG